MTKKILSGIYNPLSCNPALFGYEVVEQGELSEEVWEEDGRQYSMPKGNILLQSLNGGGWNQNQFFCTVFREDALKHLRPGEIISAKLTFHVTKKDDGSYEQTIWAEKLLTLHDYQLIHEAEAEYNGQLKAEKQNAE